MPGQEVPFAAPPRATSENSEPPSKRPRYSAEATSIDQKTDDAFGSVGTEAKRSSPPPKPRFFADAGSSEHTRRPIIPITSPQRQHHSPLSKEQVNNGRKIPEGSNTNPRDGTSRTASAQDGFDADTFQLIVGDYVNPEVIRVLRERCGNDMHRAINLYFDRTWTPLNRAMAALPATGRTSQINDRAAKSLPATPASPDQALESRYLGAFGVEGWSTCSGSNLLKHGDRVKIHRKKTQSIQTAFSKGKSNGQAASARSSATAAKSVDSIVRFTSISGAEIGRLSKETASWVSTLIDQKICRFEGTCVYAPDRLRTSDTIFLQVRCYVLLAAFRDSQFQLADNRATGLFEASETAEERELRLRQVALVKLFQEINLVPASGNASSARDRRNGLLAAAEMANKKAKDEAKDEAKPNSREDSNESPPSEEAEEGQELEQDQLDALYKKAQSFDFNTPEAEPAGTFAMTLRPYQKQALHWMMAKEAEGIDVHREPSMHPLWEEYSFPLKDVDDQALPIVAHQPSFYANMYSGELSLEFPAQQQHCLGGILADEMGLGKTIQMLALLHTHRPRVASETRKMETLNNLPRLPSVVSGQVSAPRTTLVVAPMSLLAQWQSEAENASVEGSLKIVVYYGNEKAGNLRALCGERNAASAPDLVITSYGVVLSEYTQAAAKGNASAASTQGLFSLNFFRVILDEAHSIKNRLSKTARACYEINAEHRWALTGTPIVNRLEDLFSLVRFLRVEPWSSFSYWRTFITVPFASRDFVRALDVVQTVLEPLVMRRTKDMKTPDGQALVPLPPKRVEIVDIELSQPERDVYDYVYARAKRSFLANVEAGTVLKAFTSIFAQILRLRQSCCHPVLVRNREVVADEEVAAAAADAASGLADDVDLHALIERFTAEIDGEANTATFGAHALQQIRDEAENECPICTEEPMIDQTVTGCWHSACKKCLLDYMRHQTDKHEVPRCFNCREVIGPRDLFEVVRYDDEPQDTDSGTRISLQRVGANSSSAKIVALVQRLRALRREHPAMKSVVFSQFTSFLSLIEPALARANIKFVRLDGSLAQKPRAAVLSEFAASSSFLVLLISLKAGGVGLNLTSAKRVFMMDPWWSFAVEAQAIDRVHRMGQEDEVKVCRFIVKDSVEERMLRVQDRKKFIATSLGMMTDEEKKLQRIEDIRELLS